MGIDIVSVTNKFTIIDISNSLTGIFKILNKLTVENIFQNSVGDFDHFAIMTI